MALTADEIVAVAEGIREYNRGKAPTELVFDGKGAFVSVLPQEYHDNLWYKAVEYGLRKICHE